MSDETESPESEHEAEHESEPEHEVDLGIMSNNAGN